MENSSPAYQGTSYLTAPHSKGGRGLLDSIDLIRNSETQAAVYKNPSTGGGRPSLPAPQVIAPNDALIEIAEAFIAAFTSMDNSVITQTNDYTKLQMLDETQTQCVLESTINAINKQKAAFKIAKEVNDYEKKMASDNEIFGWVMFAVGIAVMAITIGSAFVSFGATAAALPEEAIELTEFAAEEAPEMIDEASAGGEAAAETTSEASTSAATDTTETTSSNMIKWTKTIGKALMRLTVSAGFGSPMLMKGIVSLKVADKLGDVSDAQLLVGTALGKMQLNNMYFQFLQQLVQREGGVLQEETSCASEIVDTYGSILNAYKAISYGIANAA